MAGVAHTDVFDLGLDVIESAANKLVLCSAEPTTFADADGALKLAEVAVTQADYTIAAGDVSGRKITQAAKTVTGTADGTAQFFAIVDTVTSRLLWRNGMTHVAITNGNPQDVNAVRVLEIQQPV